MFYYNSISVNFYYGRLLPDGPLPPAKHESAHRVRAPHSDAYSSSIESRPSPFMSAVTLSASSSSTDIEPVSAMSIFQPEPMPMIPLSNGNYIASNQLIEIIDNLTSVVDYEASAIDFLHSVCYRITPDNLEKCSDQLLHIAKAYDKKYNEIIQLASPNILSVLRAITLIIDLVKDNTNLSSIKLNNGNLYPIGNFVRMLRVVPTLYSFDTLKLEFYNILDNGLGLEQIIEYKDVLAHVGKVIALRKCELELFEYDKIDVNDTQSYATERQTIYVSNRLWHASYGDEEVSKKIRQTEKEIWDINHPSIHHLSY